MTQKDKRSQKKRQSIIALVLVLLLSATGTFAWSSFNQRAINTLWAETNYGGRIHDNFDGFRGYLLESGDIRNQEDAPDHVGGAGIRNKDVYAENFGERPIYVRVRLLEFLAFDGEAINEYGWSVDDPHGTQGNPAWAPFRSADDDVDVRRSATATASIGNLGISWDLGQAQDEAKFFMPTFNRATHQVEPQNVGADVPGMFAHENAFIMTDATGYGVEWLSTRQEVGREVPENDDILHASYFQVIGQQSAPGLDQDLHRYYDGWGLHNNWAEGDSLTSQRLITPEVDGDHYLTLQGFRTGVCLDDPAPAEGEDCEDYEYIDTITHYAMETLRPTFETDVRTYEGELTEFGELVQIVLGLENVEDFRGVMTLTNWNELGRPEGYFWIHDNYDENGWFYWNGLLNDGNNPVIGETNATSLLLDQIDVPHFTNSWEYVIVVDGEFFTGYTLPEDRTPESDPIFNRRPDEEFLGGRIIVGGRGMDREGNLDTNTVEDSTWDWQDDNTIVVRIPRDIIGNREPSDVVDVASRDGWTHGDIIPDPENNDYFIVIFTPPGPWCNVVWSQDEIVVQQNNDVLVTPEYAILECRTIRDFEWVYNDETGVWNEVDEYTEYDRTRDFVITGNHVEGLTYDIVSQRLSATTEATVTTELQTGQNRYLTAQFPNAPTPSGQVALHRPIRVTLVSPVTASACLANGYFIDGANDIVWCSMGITEDGYTLVIAYNTHDIASHPIFGPVVLPWDEGPVIRTGVESWFAANASIGLREATAQTTDFGSAETPAALTASTFPLNGAISSPSQGTTNGTAFLPSMAEFARFAGQTDPISLFNLEHELFEAENVGGSRLGGAFGSFWLRSPSIIDFADIVFTWTIYSNDGLTIVAEPTDVGPYGNYGVRPSIWVRTDAEAIVWQGGNDLADQ